MSEEKVYTPTVIEDQALPNSTDSALLTEGGSTASDTLTPKTVKDTPLPRKVIAHETIGSSLNTLSRKILGAFEFVQQGAIQIGKFILGQSGDIRITSSGITARDQSGNTTFALDGDTGNAVFKGSVQSGSLITGDVAIESGGQVSIGGSAILDEYGIVSDSITDSSEASANAINQSITSIYTTFTEFTNSEITITLPRATNMLFIAQFNWYVTRNTGSGNMGAASYFDIFIDDTIQIGRFADIRATNAYYNDTTKDQVGPIDNATHDSIFQIYRVPAGTHTVSIKGAMTILAGDPKILIRDYNLTAIKIGS